MKINLIILAALTSFFSISSFAISFTGEQREEILSKKTIEVGQCYYDTKGTLVDWSFSFKQRIQRKVFLVETGHFWESEKPVPYSEQLEIEDVTLAENGRTPSIESTRSDCETARGIYITEMKTLEMNHVRTARTKLSQI